MPLIVVLFKGEDPEPARRFSDNGDTVVGGVPVIGELLIRKYSAPDVG